MRTMTANQREFNEESAPCFASSPKVPGEDYALVIGVNDYPKLRPLRGAVADARAFADWLVDATGGNVPKRNVFAVFSTLNPLAPIGHEINDALESIFAQAAKTGGRRLYFYFSGHGCIGDRASDIALCLANWSSLRRRAALSSDAWLDVVVRSGIFDEVAFFLDCCRVWAMRGVGLPPQIDYAQPVERTHSTRCFVAFATEFQRTALEIAANAEDVRGIFTRVLIEGLKNMAQDGQGRVTAASLKEYLELHTPKRAITFGFHQRAEVLNGFDACSQFGPVCGNRTPDMRHNDTLPIQGSTSIETLSNGARLSCNPATFMKLHEAGVFIALFNPGRIEWSLRRGNDVIPISRETSGHYHAKNQAEERLEFSQVMKPGVYVLHCSSGQPREIAIHLYPGWATQVVISDASEPHFENVRVLLVAQENRTMPMLIENGLALLGSATTALPDEWTDVLQHDPMLGLIAAHLLARAKTPDLQRINTLIDRVEAMLGPCSDVYALRLRVALIRGGDLPRASFTEPPMLREGLLAFVEASHQLPGLIPSNSLLEYACVERLVDSPLSSWPTRRANQENEDWLTAIIEDLTNEKGGDTSTLDETTIARELGVPTQAITTRLEITRQRVAATKSTPAVLLTPQEPVTANVHKIPGYELERVIGKGGMGRVYLAKRIASGERVAIKVMLPQAAVSKEARKRFLREIESMSAFKHERVVDLREFGEAHRCFYFVTSYYEEGNLAQWVRRNGRPTVERTMRIMFDVLDGLAYVHARGYVHRDIKPQNILLDADGRAVLADFGLAKNFEESGFGDITKSGATAGTPLYMPREQIVNFKRVRPSTDVWAAAAVMYWLLCSANARDIPPGDSSFLSALRSPILSIRTRGIELPIALCELLDRALSDDPAQRPEHAGAFRVQLQNAMVHVRST